MTELLYESGWTRVTRALLPGFGTVVGKELRGPDAQRRLRHESAILTRLTGVPGVVQLVPTDPEPRTILLEDVGGGSLAQLLSAGAVPPAELIGLAERLADAIAHLHRHGVIHKDINPGNVVVYGSPLRPVLIDFDQSITRPLIRYCCSDLSMTSIPSSSAPGKISIVCALAASTAPGRRPAP